MEDARIVDNVIAVLKAAEDSLNAREIVALLASRGIQIERPALNQILWTPDRNYRRSEMHVDKDYRWKVLSDDAAGDPSSENADSPKAEIQAVWALLDFTFMGIQRENNNAWFFFLEEQGDRYRIVGPKGNVLLEAKSVCSAPEECDPGVFTPEQIRIASEEWMRIKHAEFLRRQSELFRLIRDTEHFYANAYIGPTITRVIDSIPLEALLVVAPVLKVLDTEVKFGLAGVFSPVYLVVDIVALGLESDVRYGVFKLCTYDLIKKGFLLEDDEGNLCLKLKCKDGTVHIEGTRDSLLLA